MNKNCSLCLKIIENNQSGQKYHPACFLLHRKDYQKKYWKTVKGVRFSVEILKKEVENIKEDIIKEVLERIKK